MRYREFIRVGCTVIVTSLVLSSTTAWAADTGNLADLLEKIYPSVVRIDVMMGDKHALGSGYVLTEEGIVATNFHVMQGATEATAVFKNGDKAKVEGTLLLDEKRDIAILKIDKQGLTPLPLADKLPREGDSVAAFGAPLGLSFSASQGIVSAIRDGKELDEENPYPGKWIQTTAPISQGNSGGPLVNMEGQMVAMNTMVSVIGQNLNFAISSLEVADALKKAKGQRLLALSQGAARSLPSKRTSKSKNEIAAKDIPAKSLKAYVEAGQKNLDQAAKDARAKRTEAKDVLSAMREGSSTAPKASTQQKSQTQVPQMEDGVSIQMFKGKKYYHFADSATKEKAIADQQKVVQECDELVAKLTDPKQAVLNYLKSKGPELKLNTVGDLGFVAVLPIFAISTNADDELRTYFGENGIPVLVRGIKTDDLAIGSKLENKVMFVSGIESYKLGTSKVNVFVLREVPDEVLLQQLNPSSSASTTVASGAAASKAVAKESVGATKPTAPATTASDGDFRTWSDKTGKFKIEAQLIAKVDDKVLLKRRDGEIMSPIAIDKLSQTDQEYLKSKAAGAAK